MREEGNSGVFYLLQALFHMQNSLWLHFSEYQRRVSGRRGRQFYIYSIEGRRKTLFLVQRGSVVWKRKTGWGRDPRMIGVLPLLPVMVEDPVGRLLKIWIIHSFLFLRIIIIPQQLVNTVLEKQNKTCQ